MLFEDLPGRKLRKRHRRLKVQSCQSQLQEAQNRRKVVKLFADSGDSRALGEDPVSTDQNEEIFKRGKEQNQWLRRGCLVAREFANTKRDDIHLLTSSTHALPVMFLMDRGLDRGSLDITDAFQQVDQKKELQVTTNLGRFRKIKQ